MMCTADPFKIKYDLSIQMGHLGRQTPTTFVALGPNVKF